MPMSQDDTWTWGDVMWEDMSGNSSELCVGGIFPCGQC